MRHPTEFVNEVQGVRLDPWLCLLIEVIRNTWCIDVETEGTFRRVGKRTGTFPLKHVVFLSMERTPVLREFFKFRKM